MKEKGDTKRATWIKSLRLTKQRSPFFLPWIGATWELDFSPSEITPSSPTVSHFWMKMSIADSLWTLWSMFCSHSPITQIMIFALFFIRRLSIRNSEEYCRTYSGKRIWSTDFVSVYRKTQHKMKVQKVKFTNWKLPTSGGHEYRVFNMQEI